MPACEHAHTECLVSITILWTVPHAFVNLRFMAKCLLESQEGGTNKEVLSGFIFFLRFYLFVRDTLREAETQAEREAASSQGA